MRYAVFVTGPAGAGKSTFCSSLITHALTLKRTIHYVNLDPAATRFDYEPVVDIRELVDLEDVMEELEFGPNGGLVYCFEYLLNNLDWLDDQLSPYDSDYLLIDLPGQIELYTHIPLLPRLLTHLSTTLSFRCSAVYLLDSNFILGDKAKYFAGVMSAMSCMLQLGVGMICLMSKMDLLRGEGTGGLGTGKGGQLAKGGRGKKRVGKEIGRYLDPDPLLLLEDINAETNPRFHRLNQVIVDLITDHNLVSFLPLDITDEDSVNAVLSHVDNGMQYGEDEEPRMPDDMDKGDFADPDEG